MLRESLTLKRAVVAAVALTEERTQFHIDHSSPIALHYQLRRVLLQQIENGVYRPGDPFPTSRELRERYHVSTTTVEHALRWLAEHGLIYRKAGRGTVVSAAPLTEELTRLTGITEEAEARGVDYKNRILRSELIEATERQAEIFGLRSGELVFRLDRLITIRGEEPICVDLSVYPAEVGRRFLAEPSTMAGPLYSALESRFGLQLDKASQTIGAVPAARREADLLGVPVGAPMLYFDRIAYLADGRPVQLARDFFPAARYSFHVWLKRRDDEAPTTWSFGDGRLSEAALDSWD